jgi:hypothetical protein
MWNVLIGSWFKSGKLWNNDQVWEINRRVSEGKIVGSGSQGVSL